MKSLIKSLPLVCFVKKLCCKGEERPKRLKVEPEIPRSEGNHDSIQKIYNELLIYWNRLLTSIVLLQCN
jgi:hypothetical protein